MVNLKTTATIFVISILSLAFADEVSAQHRPIHRAGRFLGIGWGNGYHTRTPGPVSRYYTPYSVHNSDLHYYRLQTQQYPVRQYQNYSQHPNSTTTYPTSSFGSQMPYQNSTQFVPRNRFQPPAGVNQRSLTPTPAIRNTKPNQQLEQKSLRDNIDSLDLDKDDFEIPGAFLPPSRGNR